VVSVGVVGCGYWGPNLVRNLAENKRCGRLVCCDIDAARLELMKGRYSYIETAGSMDDLLKMDGLDAVMIATPVSSHYDLARQALEAGKHVFIEKPFTTSVRHADELISLAEECGLVLMVGHVFIYSPAVMKIKDVIDRGELGNIYYLSSTRVNLGIHQKDVSVVWDLAPHDLSMFFFWLGEGPVKVSATGKDFVQKGIMDVAFISMEFACGAIGHMQLSWLSPSKLRRTTLVGSGKMLIYDDTKVTDKVRIFDKGVDLRDPQSFGEFQLSYRTGGVFSPTLENREPLHEEVADFLDCISNGHAPRSDGLTARRVVRVIEAVECSLNNDSHVEEIVWEA
jgi:predicted dehydrogenase